ncbi:UPF0758 domain-containing protein [Arthrobacter sp. HS15c]|uniref:UPF0758 domain-containing protein n=1 Tax=Arthrobacter sp. HS15c TaxID=3230279 RepID=UPI003465C749
MTGLPESARPRERLLRLGIGALSDPELVAILLGSDRPEGLTLVTADEDLQAFGPVTTLW